MNTISDHSLFIRKFNELKISYILRSNNKYEWTNVLKELKYYSIEYTELSIDYQLAYQIGHGGEWVDYSMIIVLDGNAIGLWPITVSKKNNGYSITSQGLPIVPILLKSNVSNKYRKLIFKQVLSFIGQLGLELNIQSLSFQQISEPYSCISDWHLALMTSGATCNFFHELYVNSSCSFEHVLHNLSPNFRRNYNKGLRLWRTNILGSNSNNVAEIFDAFRKLHYSVSGRITRSDESWEIQKAAIFTGDAILSYANDNDGRIIGGALFYLSRHEACYACGAYDRSLYADPVSHVIQLKAIEFFCNSKIGWYRVGRRPFNQEIDKPSLKEQSIGQFKERLASHVFPSFVFSITT